jgi:hypothetical protein
MTIEDHYWTIRTAVRQLGRRESLYVIWAYSQYLQDNNFKFPADIQVADALLNADPPQGILAEWTLEQMAREVIQHADERPRRGRSLCQWDTLAMVANALRDLEGEIYSQLIGGERIHLELMRIAHRQFGWQQNRLNWKPIIRYYKLFNRPEIVELAQRATGLSVDQIYLIGMCFLGIFFDGPMAARQLEVNIPGLTLEHINLFLAFTSLRWNALAARLRGEHALDESFAYRYSSLREFPLVQISHHGHDEIACPIPTLLFWRITTGLYYSLKDTAGFPTAFGASFQQYVGEVLRQRITNPRMAVLEEKEYRRGRHRKDSVDWIVLQDDDSALFVECKTKRLTWASKAGLTDLSALEQDIRKLAGAVLQVYKTIADYRAGLYPHLAYLEERCVYPMIVTLEDWYLFGLDMPARLATAVRTIMEKAGLPEVWLNEMPYSILSVDELENASGVINAAGIRPVIQRKVEQPEFHHWGFGAYCKDQYRDEVRNLPGLFHDEYDAMFATLC